MKKSKKFVLATLVLLAITGLLALSGCKNDSVPPEVEKQEQGDGGGSETDKNNTATKLVSIAVTSPTRTVYSVGQSFDPTGMVVTATYDDGEERTVTGTITTDTNMLTQSAGIGKTVTVSYTEGDSSQTAKFTVDVASYKFTETVGDYEYPEGESGTMIGGTYRIFGDWPQTIKEEGVTVGKNTMTRGGMDFHVGSDGNYYVEHSEKYYKVEPIVWRMLTTSFKAPEGGTAGNVLLLAESILTGGIPYYHFDSGEVALDGKVWRGPRNNGDKTIHPNNYEHSQIRAWLNGLSYQSKESEGATQSSKDEYKNAGFLQTAFTESAQKLIADTTVDNSIASTFGTGVSTRDNPYACDKTKDKIFLLSEQEATNSEYGFGAYSEKDSTRIRVTTDFAKATRAYQSSTEGYGGWWWLRSPDYYYEDFACGIDDDGFAGSDPADTYIRSVLNTAGGVVPALSISLTGN